MTAAPASTIRPAHFAGATGRGLKVAVIDSGVNTAHPHICARTHRVLWEENTGEDQLGHGTAVTAAIQDGAPGAEYFALQLFGASLRTTTSRLARALCWTIDNGMDIVNLSLGTDNPNSRAELAILIDRARAAGIVVVTARSSNEQPMFPGSLDGVIGVTLDWSLPRHEYAVSQSGDAPVFSASGFPRSLPGRPPMRNLYGVSFAVANMTSFVARACEGMDKRSLDSVRRALVDEL